MTQTQEQIKAGFLKAVTSHYPAEQINEYVNEAEHQDGEGYWDHFTSVADFKLYWENHDA